jgi:(5-formylfuran-3-yl)methyl phosphate synthase
LKLLVSPINKEEALQAIAGGADIIDVKNPKEGPLGANYPWVIKEIKELTPKGIQVSCTLGEAPHAPASVSLAALGAASLGVDFVKVGLYGVNTTESACNLLSNVIRAAKECNPKIKVVAAGYADAFRANSVDCLLVPGIVFKAKADVAMIDTAVKDGKNTFEFLSKEHLKKFVDLAHGYGLQAALAGSLRKTDLAVVYDLGADIAGLRGAACTKEDRLNGVISKQKVQELVEIIKNKQEI